MDNFQYDTIEMLGKRSHLNTVISNEEQRSLLPSSKDIIRCSSLDLEDSGQETEVLLGRLAELIVQSYFYTKKQSKE